VAVPITESMTEEAYREFALGDTSGLWELVRGQLRERPAMTARHGDVMDSLLHQLYEQLDRQAYRLRVQHARLRHSSDTYYIPDVAVVPTLAVETLLDHPGETLDAYPEPLPLVVEIWSPSTGRYDIHEKLPDYKARGDPEIWYIHPYERTLTAWRRQPDGTYTESVYRGGVVVPPSLPGVAIEIELLFGR
jgi:Uma2 family endonuclease